MKLANVREDQPHWLVRREEVELTEVVIGKGGWGEVRVAKFRGLHVAAKCLYQDIRSDYNLNQFTHELVMTARLRHPNLLMLIGATREDEPLILTELMPTSLRKELDKKKLPNKQIVSIAQDVASALRYLHQWRPSPIIHRDISSANVLLELLTSNGWRAKVSDLGSANFMNCTLKTVGPGNPAYSAPEAWFPEQHSPKMDIFSYGMLLAEMCLRVIPDECSIEKREAHIRHIKWVAMASLIRSCTSECPDDRPSMSDRILERLGKMY